MWEKNGLNVPGLNFWTCSSSGAWEVKQYKIKGIKLRYTDRR